MIFVNLPVRDLAAARAFYEALGFGVHAGFTDEQTAAIVVDDDIVVMLHSDDRFAELVSGEVGDPSASTTATYCLSAASREEVDELVATALDAGGRSWLPARSDGLRYTGSFTDPDGHVWEVMWMDQLHVVN
jgi:predicted lactoylglutathione lyase